MITSDVRIGLKIFAAFRNARHHFFCCCYSFSPWPQSCCQAGRWPHLQPHAFLAPTRPYAKALLFSSGPTDLESSLSLICSLARWNRTWVVKFGSIRTQSLVMVFSTHSITKTALEYMLWRYQTGEDLEELAKANWQVSAEEAKKMNNGSLRCHRGSKTLHWRNHPKKEAQAIVRVWSISQGVWEYLAAPRRTLEARFREEGPRSWHLWDSASWSPPSPHLSWDREALCWLWPRPWIRLAQYYAWSVWWSEG